MSDDDAGPMDERQPGNEEADHSQRSSLPFDHDSPVAKVAAICAVLAGEQVDRDRMLTLLEMTFGPIGFVGAEHPFDATDYYRDEMGEGLVRTLLAFEVPFPSEALAPAKLVCGDLERMLAIEGRRTANLDFGYLDPHKVVLASLKEAGQKIHVGMGVWADPIARWRDGAYRPFEWTFPDFRSGRYDAELIEIRRRLRERTRAARREG